MAHIFRPRYRYEVVRKKLFDRDFGAAGTDAANLLADNVTSASEVSTPTLGQVHVLTNGSIVESESEVTQPTVNESHILLADDIESASELTAPTLAESVFALSADDVESASEVTTPTVGQEHAILADDVESASEVFTPALSPVVVTGPNVIYLWKGAVQPNDLGEASGNEIVLHKGAVQPARVYTAPVVEAPSKKGGRVKKRKRRYFVEIDGELFEASSQQEATDILIQARELAKEQAPKIPNPGVNIPKIKVLTRTKRPVRAKALKTAEQEAQESISRIYHNAQVTLDAAREVTAEAAQRKLREQKRIEALQRDEDDAITLILLS